MKKRNDGFTLVELSAVLLLIALIVGGIVGGKVLVRNAELRSLTVDAQSYIAATRSFRDQYNAYPGDFTQATSLWGSIGTPCATAVLTGVPAAYPSPTCDGNGNGSIDSSYEITRFWQHLSNAGMIPGRYSGASASNVGDHVLLAGVNAPVSRIQGSLFGILNLGEVLTGGSASYFVGSYNHTLEFGRANAANGEPTDPTITAAEASTIDQKIDDGVPGTGFIRAQTSTGWANCTTGARTSPELSLYNLSYTGNAACGLIFVMDAANK